MTDGFLDEAHPGQIFADLALPVEARAGGRAHVEMAREAGPHLVVGDGLQRFGDRAVGYRQAVMIEMARSFAGEGEDGRGDEATTAASAVGKGCFNTWISSWSPVH